MLKLAKNVYHEHPFLLDWARTAYTKYNRKKMISFSSYDRQNAEIKENFEKELEKIWEFRSDYEFWFYERDFERLYARHCKKKFAITANSGTAALQLSLIAAGIGKCDEVITTPYTYIATPLAIANADAKPVFVDIDNDYNIDTSEIEEAITENTKAIMPVHLYGQPCNMDEIMNIAKKHRLQVIEDCCQAQEVGYKNKKIPIGGGCFSFHTSKLLGGLGNGGAIVTNDKNLKRKLEILKNPTADEAFLLLSKRTPCELDAVQIAFIKAKLPFIKEWVERKREIAKIYNKEFSGTGIITPIEGKYVKHSWFSYAIRSSKRNKLQRFLLINGVETRADYDTPIHLTKTFRYLGHKRDDFPESEKTANEVLCLPMNPFLKDEEVMKIARLVNSFR
ncbi:MAG: DegT/DnrJ/EryC1/StrS family aminotransferase [Candidatus Aenigmatarchaeota archaeon]